MPWFGDLVQLSTEIPLRLPVSTTLFKQSHNQVFHNNPQHLNLHRQLQEQGFSEEVAEKIAVPQRSSTHQQQPSTSQNGPYLRAGAEKIW